MGRDPTAQVTTFSIRSTHSYYALHPDVASMEDCMIALFVEKSTFLPKPYTVEQLGTVLSLKFDLHSDRLK